MAKAPRKRKATQKSKRGRFEGRPAKKTDPKAIARAMECAAALRLRKLGHSIEDVGRQMDPPCGVHKAHALIVEGLRAVQEEDVADVRKLEMQRLDSLTLVAMRNALDGDIRAVEATLKIMQRRAALLGYDMPAKTEFTGKDGQPLFSCIERVVVDSPHRDAALDAALPPAS